MPISSIRSAVPVAIVVMMLSACSKERPADGGDTTATTGASAHANMPGMSAMGGDSSAAQMQSHMRMMQGAAADSMKAMLPMHRQMLGSMLAQFDRDMSGMNMGSDNSWKALTDSVRQDNTRLANLSASELRTFMPAHHARVTKLIDMHHSMMGKK